ncbi:hypothetical protein, partial [Streptomyces sp. NPDC059515]|uniref:hypothetical protein n=1 Tax=Streptomyces sp. NPDC059515 TaxID=3346854 RepID=UPI0036C4BD91
APCHLAVTILTAGAPLRMGAPRPPRRLAHRIRARRDRARADRALLRLARESCGRPDCPTCLALHHLAHGDPHVHTLANDPERSPEWCHRHGCHRSQCPGPQQGGH